MKVWIDLTNAPHVIFFKKIIKILEERGNKVLITCRDHSNTIDLIKMNKWDYHIIGEHAGKNLIKKIIYFFYRTYKLFLFLNKQKIDLGLSHSSFESSFASTIIGIPSIYINDNEHAIGNISALLFADKIILPDCLSNYNLANFFSRNKLVFYPGVKESIYLHDENYKICSSNKGKIYFRLDPWNAQYYNSDIKQLNSFMIKLSKKEDVIILPRSKKQIEYYTGNQFKNLKVLTESKSLNEILKNCKFFIGAGGSMTREMAVLGIPTLSVYQEELLEVDKYLINQKLLYHNTNPNISNIYDIIKKKTQNKAQKKILLDQGKKALMIILETIQFYEK